jgi:predicted glycogen debranching enzyme
LITASLEHVPSAGIDDAETLARFSLAADDFVVHPRHTHIGSRDYPPTSIIAGYPWFTDWGRDTMIAIPGLLLESGRFTEALCAMRRFADARRRGIIPNRFTDVGSAHAGEHGATGAGEPEYNTIDASLWFVVTACRYLHASEDRSGFEKHLLPACVEVIEAYRHGTDFGIAMDPVDFLIAGGSAATQLTWMDARRDGVSFTPRHGKAVEINALWHASLRMLADAVHPEPPKPALSRADAATLAADMRSLADAVARSFRATFFSESLGCCFDAITPTENGRWQPSSEVRPNQIFAVSLPYSPLTREQQQAVVRTVRERLLTAFGVRTLAPGSRAYASRFRGPLRELDAAYHNGTAWPWLLGAYSEAVARAGEFSAQAIEEARQALRPIVRKLDAECVGSIAEVFDAEGEAGAPQRAGGCPAQAWSVAEVRRVMGLLGRGH